MTTTVESPLARLTEQELEKLAKELDAIHDEIFSELGDRDRNYIKAVISVQRQIVVAGRVLLLASRSRTALVAGTACLGMAKILENMELGHNILHGQWDWMNDPDIHSSVWDWDTASTAKAWKHSHNYIHHTYTNIRGKDKDLGYEIMRIDPNQKWRPANLGQPLYNFLLTVLFEWGVALHDTDVEALWRGQKTMADLKEDFRGIAGKARLQIIKDYVGWPLISAGAFALAQLALRGRIDQPAESRVARRLRQISTKGRIGATATVLDRLLPGVESTFLRTLAADALANLIRNVWAHAIIFCGHFPDQTYTFSEEEVENESRGGWYVRQLIGAANIEGSPLFHVISGNLGYQVEHHLYPDMPSSRYSEIAPRIKDICERYELPYNSGRFGKQWFSVHRTIFRLAFPGGKPRPKPGPYRSQDRNPTREAPSEAVRFRDRLPAEHPDAGPEHASTGVAVQPPPRGND
ncbi:fatty acid desaturase family protein [Mycolicibacterium monacense]|uniref:Fatty acid desaturase n=4 Tax=Mycobacteriaceae TaxID=1762 RepID=A0AAD1J247_MYCMB|nr:acyl-CoA desaturase [Mycolicibacterium monacense]MDA4105049.1 fatty acid desaturase [Mycolicibacterium monacense DSM 44395]OBB68831.1 fatty acid desaturase [Mycolicibacterium monacense]OBF56878.1 fatty acid desaturase [Mycolicibacterium monacense]ORB23785.1 acyl-CoA desaturase [Mycolicibacterium monacense DSM 44395]QHP85959.1 acyl-CoA desaturase [Mycolicibacterium monacense DSM 44395]